MLSFFDALEFAFHKRTFIFGMLPMIVLCLLVFLGVLFSDALVALGSRFDIVAFQAILLRGKAWLVEYGDNASFWILLWLIIELMYFMPKSFVDAYFIIKAKRTTYEQDGPFSH